MPPRLTRWNYAEPAGYFITACTHSRQPMFGEVVGERVDHSPLGALAVAQLRRTFENSIGTSLEAFVVMPDHVHLLIARTRRESGASIDRLVQQFKARVTFHARRLAISPTSQPVWQRGFFDRVVRNADEQIALRAYVETNPLRWTLKHRADR